MEKAYHVGFHSKMRLKREFRDENNVLWYSLKNNITFFDGKRWYCIPANGFFTDLATSPKYLHWLIPPNGEYARASIFHDYLYDDRITLRSKCDKLFLIAMKVDGVSFLKRWGMYLAVRCCGRAYFNR